MRFKTSLKNDTKFVLILCLFFCSFILVDHSYSQIDREKTLYESDRWKILLNDAQLKIQDIQQSQRKIDWEINKSLWHLVDLEFEEERGSFDFEARRIGSCKADLSKLKWKAKDNTLELNLQTRSLAKNKTAAVCPEIFVQIQVDEFSVSMDASFSSQIESKSHDFVFEMVFASNPDESIFGHGEQFSYIDLKGKVLPIFVQEQGLFRRKHLRKVIKSALPVLQKMFGGMKFSEKVVGDDFSTYFPMPQYLSSDDYLFYLKNSELSVFDHSRKRQRHVFAFSKNFSGEWLFGGGPRDLLQKFGSRVGKMTAPPDWTQNGLIVGVQGGQEKVEKIQALLKKNNVAVAGYWLQDWVGQRTTSFGKQLWWQWVLDKEHYPRWHAMREKLEKKKQYLLGYFNPFLVPKEKVAEGQRDLFEEAKSAGYLVKNQQGDVYPSPVTFTAYLVDLTNPQAYFWLKEVMKEVVRKTKMKGWMADFGEALPVDAALYSGDAKEIHNQYPVLWAKLNAEVVRELKGEGELFYFMRAGYTGSLKHNHMFWTGDQMVHWDGKDGLRASLKGILSGGFSGINFNHSDIGGYTTLSKLKIKRKTELLKRWSELNAFTAIFRSHEGNQPEHNVQNYHENNGILEHTSKMSRLFHALKFYRLSLFEEAVKNNLPLIRHPYLLEKEYQENWRTRDEEEIQFYLGDEILVAPVLKESWKKRSVELPLVKKAVKKKWIQLWSGKSYTPGLHKLSAPIGEIPVFYREDSLIRTKLESTLCQMSLINDQRCEN